MGLTRRSLIAAGGAAALCAPAVFAAAAERHRAVTVDLAVHDVSLHWKDADGRPYGDLRRLREALERQGRRVLALSNAGIYGRDLAPLGLHVEAGEVLRPLNTDSGGGNFFLEPNGVFSVSAAGAAVTATDRFSLADDVVAATQSGPLLFDERGLHPRFLVDATSRYVRNGVGVRGDGQVVLAISAAPVTFWEFAAVMRDDLGCTSALYLDGNICLLWRAEDRIMPAQWRPFVGMLAVTER